MAGRQWIDRFDRALTLEGLALVVAAAMKSVMAPAAMKRRHPMSTLGSSPLRSVW